MIYLNFIERPAPIFVVYLEPKLASRLGGEISRNRMSAPAAIPIKKRNPQFFSFFPVIPNGCQQKKRAEKQGITDTLTLPIDQMLYICLLCPHSEHQNNLFQFRQSKHFHQRNRFTQCETGSNKVKLSKVGSKATVPGPNKADL